LSSLRGVGHPTPPPLSSPSAWPAHELAGRGQVGNEHRAVVEPPAPGEHHQIRAALPRGRPRPGGTCAVARAGRWGGRSLLSSVPSTSPFVPAPLPHFLSCVCLSCLTPSLCLFLCDTSILYLFSVSTLFLLSVRLCLCLSIFVSV
jgi:hypothetical protein